MECVRSQQRGVTLVEVLVVAGILVLLAGIGFALMAPAKAKGMEAACMTNLRQIYAAWTLYNADVDPSEEFPGVGPFSLYPTIDKSALVPYGIPREAWYCPAAPECARKGPTYHHPFMAPYFLKGDGSQELIRRMQGLVENHGQEAPLLRCFIHDELIYQPKEKETDIYVRKPFAIELLLNGTVTTGRVKGPGDVMIRARCSPMEVVVIP